MHTTVQLNEPQTALTATPREVAEAVVALEEDSEEQRSGLERVLAELGTVVPAHLVARQILASRRHRILRCRAIALCISSVAVIGGLALAITISAQVRLRRMRVESATTAAIVPADITLRPLSYMKASPGYSPQEIQGLPILSIGGQKYVAIDAPGRPAVHDPAQTAPHAPRR